MRAKHDGTRGEVKKKKEKKGEKKKKKLKKKERKKGKSRVHREGRSAPWLFAQTSDRGSAKKHEVNRGPRPKKLGGNEK